MSGRKTAVPHSPEPWSVVDGAEIMVEPDTENAMVILACGFHFASGEQPPAEVNAANAHRIAACVNAFAGWSTEDVEALARMNLRRADAAKEVKPSD